MRTRIVAAVVAATTLAWADRATSVYAHDGYEKWMSPEGISCCNDRDCAPADPCWIRRKTGGIGARAPDGSCIELPEERQIHPPGQITVPDGLHVCWQWLQGAPVVRCWALVGGI